MILITAGEICGYIDNELTDFIHSIIVLIEIAVPVLLIIFGMLDFAKGVIAAKEDEMKKGQQTFIKRCISAAIVFFIFSITQLITGIVARDDSEVWSCAAALMNGTNKQIHQTTYTPSDISTDTKESCCTQAGGKIDSNGVCSAYNDQNGERHTPNGEAYNQCTQSLEQQKENEEKQAQEKENQELEKMRECCTKAGGKFNTNNECTEWHDVDSGVLYKPDITGYNKCLGK